VIVKQVRDKCDQVRQKCDVMNLLQVSVSVTLLLTLTLSSASSRDFNRRQLAEALLEAKRNKIEKCAEVSGQCFSTSHCCDSLVCVAMEDYFGEKPEVPGSCVKEKDLRECVVNSDCDQGESCKAMGRAATQKYCMPEPRRAVEELTRYLPTLHHSVSDSAKGSLGSACQTSSECKLFTNNGQEEMCCKDIHRGRLGIKRQCDRVDTMGACIGPR